MRSYTLITGLSLLLPSFALVAYQPCLTTTALPMVTVKGGPDGYYTEYTRTYREFYPQGLTKKVYTVTQICSDLDCQTPPIETAPPPGFTAAVVKCSACGGQGTQVATLTFPTESVEAYSSSGYLVEPLDLVQATKGWMDQVNSPPAFETANVNGDAGMNAENVPPTPGSSDSTGSEPQEPQNPQTPSNGGSQEDQNGNGSLGDASSHHVATEHTGSTSGGGDSSDGQNPGSMDGTDSAKGWQSSETGNNPGSGSASGDTQAGSIPQDGSSSSSSSSSSSPSDATGPQDQGSNTPGHSNDPTGDTPADAPASDVASVDGEPATTNNNKPDDTANTTSPDGVNGASGDTSASPDNNSGLPSSQNNNPPVVDSDSKQAGNDNDPPEPDAPLTVSGAGSFKLNTSACIITNAACIFIVWLL